jgi:hypothetical protein
MFDIGRQKKWLGISVGERSLLVGEVSCAGDGQYIGRTVEFAYPIGLSLEHAGELGESLRLFLQQRGFSARKTVFGVPAKWLIIRPHTVPPADEQTIGQMLWLYTSARMAPELGPMAFDFAGQGSSTQQTVVTLVGLQQQWIDRLKALARAAGLAAISITSCGASLAAATAANADQALILLLRRDGAELITQEHGEVRTVRHAGPLAAIRPLIAELRRAAAAMPDSPDSTQHQQAASENSRRSLALWDDVGADGEYLKAVQDAAGFPLVKAQPQWIGLSRFDQPEGKGLSAVALTWAVRNGSRTAVDFLHPRLAPPRIQPVRPRALWVAAAAAILLLILGGVIDMTNLQREISRPQNQLEALGPQLAVATPFVASMQFAESFQTGRPRYLACLRDLTAALPAEGMYFLDFNLAMDMKGQVSGRTGSDQNVLKFMDKVNTSGRFLDTHCRIYAHEARDAQSGNEISFTLMFTYVSPT